MEIKELMERAENTMLALNRLIVPGARTQGLSLIASFKREVDTAINKEAKPAPKKPAPKKTTPSKAKATKNVKTTSNSSK